MAFSIYYTPHLPHCAHHFSNNVIRRRAEAEIWTSKRRFRGKLKRGTQHYFYVFGKAVLSPTGDKMGGGQHQATLVWYWEPSIISPAYSNSLQWCSYPQFISTAMHNHAVSVLTHVPRKPTHSFFQRFMATMSNFLQTSFNRVMKDWHDKYHVWGTPSRLPSRLISRYLKLAFFHCSREHICMCYYRTSGVYMSNHIFGKGTV